MKKVLFLSLMTFACSSGNPIVFAHDYSSDVCVAPAAALPTLLVCPHDMINVEGDYCETLVHTCKKWISEKRDRCAEYVEDSARCFGKVAHMHFCIDRYEWPNKIDEMPQRGMTWWNVKSSCESIGKRLCTVAEWEQSCEGPKRTPYPYGWKRSKYACNIDKKYIFPNNDLWYKNRKTEMERLDQSESSGNRPNCVSEYGVYDLTGNVDEFVYDPHGHVDGGVGIEPHYDSALKGGYWATVRNRCRPETVSHNRDHFWYNTGGRCCKDATI